MHKKCILNLLKTSIKWSQKFRQKKRGNNTNNIDEATVDVLKDKVLRGQELTMFARLV